jgi:hypothetical protein
VEYDNPKKLMETEGSLFHELVKEYWSYTHRMELSKMTCRLLMFACCTKKDTEICAHILEVHVYLESEEKVPDIA